VPGFIARQRLRSNHRYHILRRRLLLKINFHILIEQRRFAKRRTARNPVEIGLTERHQIAPIL